MSQTTDIMNCNDYKEALAADPNFNGESGHVHSCADCQAYSSDMLAFDEKIAAAMQTDVPDLVMPELPDIDNENVVALSTFRPTSAPVWLAIAACVAMIRNYQESRFQTRCWCTLIMNLGHCCQRVTLLRMARSHHTWLFNKSAGR